MTEPAQDALELEGMVSTLTVLKVMSPELPSLRESLRAKLSQMPDLFESALIALDLSGIDGHPDELASAEALPELAPLTLEAIVGLLRAEGCTPVAVRNVREERAEEATRLGLGRVRSTPPRSKRGAKPAKPSASQKRDDPPPTLCSPSLTLRQPVRGGQVVYAKGADAVALAPINAGGELIADGNIHVYGPLRGRALAGAHGDTEARIFCTSLQAELVSVAGVYLQAEDLESHRGKPAQIYLDGEKLVVTDL